MVEKTVKKLKTSSGRPWEDEFRLPNSTHPDHYDLYLHPDLITKTFSGRVTIHITTSETRDHFLVHTKWLNISQTKVVKLVEGETTEVGRVIYLFCFISFMYLYILIFIPYDPDDMTITS